MTKDEALKLALEALEWANKEINAWMDDAQGLEPEDHPEIMFAVNAIKEALAQRPWVELTEDETIELLPVGDWEIESTLDFAQAIEAKLKEKNHD